MYFYLYFFVVNLLFCPHRFYRLPFNNEPPQKCGSNIYLITTHHKYSLMARETGVQPQVVSYQRLKKWYLMPPCLTLGVIRHGSWVKWNNPLHLGIVVIEKGAFGLHPPPQLRSLALFIFLY